MTTKATGLLKSYVKKGENWAVVSVLLENVEKVKYFFLSGYEDSDITSCPVNLWYTFDYTPPAREGLNPKVEKRTWKHAVPEDKILTVDMDEQECPDLLVVWNKLFKKLNWRTRKQLYTELEKGQTDMLQQEWKKVYKVKKLVLGDVVEDAKKLRARIEESVMFLKDPLFKNVVSSCENVAKLLRWDLNTGKSMDVSSSKSLWEALLKNPYDLAYGGNPKFTNERLLKLIKKFDMNKLDQLFVQHGQMKENEDRRVEYLIYDSINHGRGPLRNTATCYSVIEIYNKIEERSKERRSKKSDDDEDRDTQGIKSLVPDMGKIKNFLERIRDNQGEIDPRCAMRICFDKDYYYDSPTLDKEIKLAKIMAKRIKNNKNTDSLEPAWNEFKRLYGDYITLSDEQEQTLRRLLNLDFHIVLGAAGTGKTNLEATLILFLEWAGYTVYIGCMVGKAAVRASQIIFEKDLQFVGKQKSKVLPKTLFKLYYDILMFGRQATEEETILIIDEGSTVSFFPLVDLLKKLRPKRLYIFGDEKQLLPILGQHVLDDWIELRDDSFISTLETIYRGHGSSSALASRMWECKTPFDRKKFIEDMKKCDSLTVNSLPKLDNVLKVVKTCLDGATFGNNNSIYTNFPLIIAPTNDVVEKLGKEIRPIWLQRTNNESYHLHESEGGKQAFLVGDRVMCLQNIYSSPDGSGSKEYVDEDESDFEDNEENMKKKAALLANKSIIFAHGEVGIVRNIFGNMSPPELEVEKLRSDGTPCGKLEHYETKLFKCCYAFTVNKVQGSEQGKTIVISATRIDNEGNLNNVSGFVDLWRGYTAVTRHTQHCFNFSTDGQLMSMLNNRTKKGYRSFLTSRIREMLATREVVDTESNTDSDEEVEERPKKKAKCNY